MDDTSTRAINFAVALIVTLVVVTLVVASFSKIKEVYKLTKNTDISLHGRFENIYQTYDGKELNGMGLLNTIKKFEDSNKYKVEVKEVSGKTVINFK